MASPQNVLLITADSVRRDHLSLYGYERETTPVLEEHARTVFQNAYANGPFTATSLPSMLTGTYPLERGHLATNPQPTIHDRLAETAYTTCIAHSNIQLQRFGYESRGDNLITFLDDLSVDHRENPLLRFAKWGLNRGGVIGRLSTYARDTYHRFSGPLELHPPDDTLIQETGSWIERANEPYFVWVHLMDTHTPYTFDRKDFEAVSPEQYDPNRYARLLARSKTHKNRGDFLWELSEEQRQYIIDAYDASIRHMDALIGDLLSSVDLETTTVLFSSDHGEELWDHGHFGHSGGDAAPRPLTLYEELLEIPLCLLGSNTPDVSVPEPVSLIDIYPTVAELAGEPAPEAHGMALIDRSGEVIQSPADREIHSQLTVPGDPVTFEKAVDGYRKAACIAADEKFIYDESGDNEFYNLDADPSERTNYIGDIDEEIWMRRVREYLGAATGAVIEDDEAIKEHLSELGYLN